MTMDHFPSLRRLIISDDIIGEKAFLHIVYPFFKLVNLALDLSWIIPIGSNSSYEDEVFLPRNGWRQLDALLTSSQYPSLRRVYIQICFLVSWDLRLDPVRYARFRDIYHLPSLFPLLAYSHYINFDFELGTAEHEGF